MFSTGNMKKFKIFAWVFQISIVLLLLISGCSVVEKTQLPASDTPILKTIIPTESIKTKTVSSKTVTETILPISETPISTTSPPNTTTATQTSTWTPVATLSAETLKQNLIELFSTNDGCEFPCWWGVSPGDSIEKVSELGPVVGKSLRRDALSYYYILSLDDLNFADFDVNYFVDKNQSVSRMEIMLSEPSRFRDYYPAFEERLALSSLLKYYGKPSEILLVVEPMGGPNVPREYALFVIYDAQGFGVIYGGLVDTEDPLQVCSIQVSDHKLKYIWLYLQNPRVKLDDLNRFYLHDFMLLEQVSSMDIDSFYNAFISNDRENCIETSIDHWE